MRVSWIAAAAFIIPTLAAAMVRPGWERPLYQAELQVVDVAPELESEVRNAKSLHLIMTQQDGFKTPSGFILLIDDRTIEFGVDGLTQDRCGSTEFVARAGDGASRITLKLVTHVGRESTGTCGQAQGHAWELSLLGEQRVLLNAVADPQPVFSIM
ncbi:MAG: hypothetical protein NDJ90_15275 [Oligoflexia bacterium]|nr:hypothetical protein [Oligoflexia bacterium]